MRWWRMECGMNEEMMEWELTLITAGMSRKSHIIHQFCFFEVENCPYQYYLHIYKICSNFIDDRVNSEGVLQHCDLPLHTGTSDCISQAWVTLHLVCSQFPETWTEASQCFAYCEHFYRYLDGSFTYKLHLSIFYLFFHGDVIVLRNKHRF